MFLIFLKSCLNFKISPITVNLDYNGSTNGLFRKLLKNYSSLENSGILNMSASSIYPGGYYPKNVLYDDSSYFHSDNGGIPGEYLQFDFLENLISLSSYTFKSRDSCCYMKNWKVNGSINGIEWNTISEVIEEVYMCSNLRIKTFFSNDQTNYRYIRFISTSGLRCDRPDSIININLIEFFGSININLKFKSQKKNNNLNFSVFLFLMIFSIIV